MTTSESCQPFYIFQIHFTYIHSCCKEDLNLKPPFFSKKKGKTLEENPK